MNDKIVISGVGVVSAIGLEVSSNLKALLNESHGIGPIQYLDTVHKDEFVVGEVKLSNTALCDQLMIAESDRSNYTRTALLGCLAAKEAAVMAGLSERELGEMALISGTTVGGMDRSELEWGNRGADASFIHTHPCGDSTDKIADLIGINGYRTTLSTACSSAANAIIHGIRLIRSGRAKRVIAGGVDALSRFTLNGFNSLMIVDKELCRPFDATRRGLNLGEGAGFVVLEAESTARERGAEMLCQISGYANANDAYHQTASSPDGQGAYLAMTKALELAGLSIDDIDYINAHGTGTDNNDQSEATAIKRVFGEKVPPFSSTKAYTGHTLGAAAGIEAVYSILALQNQLIYPNLRFTQSIEEPELLPETTLQTNRVLKHVLSNSFGFGGNNSTLIFSKL